MFSGIELGIFSVVLPTPPTQQLIARDPTPAAAHLFFPEERKIAKLKEAIEREEHPLPLGRPVGLEGNSGRLFGSGRSAAGGG